MSEESTGIRVSKECAQRLRVKLGQKQAANPASTVSMNTVIEDLLDKADKLDVIGKNHIHPDPATQ